MLTNNFYNLLLNEMNMPGQQTTVTKYNGSAAITIDPMFLLQGLRYVRSGSPSTAGMYGIFFGTGTTLPTREDYTLESPITNGTLSSSCGGVLKGLDADQARLYATHEVKNSGSTDVTITEVGVFGCASDTSTNVFLLDRTVLDTPITIPAGQSKSITVAVQFDYPAK